MAILSLVVVDMSTKIIKMKTFNLKKFSFFTRGTVKDTITFVSQELANNLETYEFQEYVHKFNDDKTYKLFSLVYNNFAYIACTDDEYPASVAHKFLLEVRKGNVEQVMEDYQDPKSKDVMMQVQEEIDKTKEELSKSLMSVLERNNKLEDLAEKSQHLCYQTKLLFKEAKKKNRCC